MRKKRGSSLSLNKKKVFFTPARIREIFSWVFVTVFAVVMAFVVVMTFGVQVEMLGESMEPTIENDQKVLINKLIYRLTSPKEGDVIAFLPNGNVRSREYIKRVVAVSGDTVQIADGLLYVNGQVQDITDTVYDEMEEAGIASSQIKLAAGEFFVLGDNRNFSEDSRSANIGVVKRDMILGKVWFLVDNGTGRAGFLND